MKRILHKLSEHFTCSTCGSEEVYYENALTGSGMYTCQDCETLGNEEDFSRTKVLSKNVRR